jgi:hypothetical protein
MLIATQHAVYRLDANDLGAPPEIIFEGSDILRVVEGLRTDVVLLKNGDVVTLEDGKDKRISTKITDPPESMVVLNEKPLEMLIGTEGAHIYKLQLKIVRKIVTFEHLGVRDSWYTPWGGPPAVRSFAVTADGRVYADIHVGSIMRSSDRGENWEPVTPDLNEDVHQVVTCRAASQWVYANTARGVFVSEDRGQTWHDRGGGLGHRYGRAIAVPPDDAHLMLASVSDGPHGDDVHGQLYRSTDFGKSWEHIGDGFPASTKRNINTYHLAFSSNDLGWAAVGSRLYVGESRALRWRLFWEAPEYIIMIDSH